VRGARRLRKQRADPIKRFTDLWLSADVPPIPASMLRAAARSIAIETRRWEP
jgi:hypothetical protein